MESLVEDLLTALPSSYQSEEYLNRLQKIEDEFQERHEQAFKRLNMEAEERGIAIKRTPTGYTLGPVIDDELLDQKEFIALPITEQERLKKLMTDIQIDLQRIVRDLPLVEREQYQRTKALNQEITQHTVEKLIAWIENSYVDQAEVITYLGTVKKNVIEYSADFLPTANSTDTTEITNMHSRVAEFHEYRINVIVDGALVNSSNSARVPIVFEDNPTYKNIIGRIEYISQMGTLLTDFTLIKSGALHRANGGYLIIDAHKLLNNAYAWEGLKRALKAKKIHIESLDDMLSLDNAQSLEPEAIPFKVKVILIGDPEIYFLLREYDREFSRFFKVVVDFSQQTDRNAENSQLYARLIAALQSRNCGLPLNRKSVGRIIEHASRLAGDSEKLSLQIESLEDLLHESGYWAAKKNHQTIQLEDVEKTLKKQRYRQNKYAEQMQEQIIRGIKLIDCKGDKIGQVNALSVFQVGDFAFGQASRITATARLGHSGIIDIEREVKLGGELHSKGVMILSSYLAKRYASNRPLPLAASLVFEQSYGKIDGDSASAAELCVLLSALGNIPVKQAFAVTGSINQLGEMQAIGGVNEKIEGFFAICQTRGLDGTQGVIIPASNQSHLMLHSDIRAAVTEKKFSIYSAEHVDDMMALLSGLSIGAANTEGLYPELSFNGIIQCRVEELQQLQKRYANQGKNVDDH